jgi:hypothetical protein
MKKAADRCAGYGGNELHRPAFLDDMETGGRSQWFQKFFRAGERCHWVAKRLSRPTSRVSDSPALCFPRARTPQHIGEARHDAVQLATITSALGEKE